LSWYTDDVTLATYMKVVCLEGTTLFGYTGDVCLKGTTVRIVSGDVSLKGTFTLSGHLLVMSLLKGLHCLATYC
jgi:hypothetical protein